MHLDVDSVDVDGADVLPELLDVDELVDIIDVVVVLVVLVDLVDVIDEVLYLEVVDGEVLVVLLVLLKVVVEDDDRCEEVLDDRDVDVQVVI